MLGVLWEGFKLKKAISERHWCACAYACSAFSPFRCRHCCQRFWVLMRVDMLAFPVSTFTVFAFICSYIYYFFLLNYKFSLLFWLWFMCALFVPMSYLWYSGGGSSLSRHERDEIRAEVDAEFDAEQWDQKKKRKKTQKRTQAREDDLGSLFGEGITGKLPRYANKITFKVLKWKYTQLLHTHTHSSSCNCKPI